MSAVLDAFDNREHAEREAAKVAKRQQQRVRDAVVSALASPDVRYLLALFWQDAGLDATSYRERPTAMAFAAGWQDAARWWQHAIREHCPEREAQLRAEARRTAREGATDEADDAS